MELKPCPFCGGPARTCEDTGAWAQCEECGCRLGFDGLLEDSDIRCGKFMDEDDAACAWNRRYGEEYPSDGP